MNGIVEAFECAIIALIIISAVSAAALTLLAALWQWLKTMVLRWLA